MLHRYHTICILRRRPISPEPSSVRFSTVRQRYPCIRACLSVLTSSARLILGMIIVLFFKCIAALFNPAHRRGEPIKWGLVSYTVVMFLISTIQNAMDLNLQSVSFIDNREYPAGDCMYLPGPVGYDDVCVYPPGPVGYQLSISSGALDVVPNVMFSLGNWLAEGLLVSSLFYTALTTQVSNVGSSPSSIVAT